MRSILLVAISLALVGSVPNAAAGCTSVPGVTVCDFNNDGTPDYLAAGQGTPVGYAFAVAYRYGTLTLAQGVAGTPAGSAGVFGYCLDYGGNPGCEYYVATIGVGTPVGGGTATHFGASGLSATGAVASTPIGSASVYNIIFSGSGYTVVDSGVWAYTLAGSAPAIWVSIFDYPGAGSVVCAAATGIVYNCQVLPLP